MRWLALSALVLAGCATAPAYHPCSFATRSHGIITCQCRETETEIIVKGCE